MAREPSRVAKITTTVEVEVNDPELLDLAAELSEVACTCPMCNSLNSEMVMVVVPVMAGGETRAAVGAGAAAGC
jgi:uncharacterized OsmC-like protein